MAESGWAPEWLTQRFSPATRSAAYWLFFALYTTITVLWLVLATWSVFFTSTFPETSQMHLDAGGAQHAQDAVLSLATMALALVLIWRAPENTVARWFAVALVGTSAGFSLTAHHFLDGIAHSAMDPALAPLPLAHVAFHLIAGGAYAVGLLLFPDGKFPRLSPLLSSLLLLLAGLMAGLIIQGHEPAYFFLFCGVAVVICGPFSQWRKSKTAVQAKERAQSAALFHAFMWLIGLALAIALFEVVVPWAHHFDPKTQPGSQDFAGPRGWWATFALTALPPLLAAVAIVVVFVIVEHSLFGGSSRRRQLRMAKVLLGAVAVLYTTTDILIHKIADKLGDEVTTRLAFSLLITVVIALALEGPREAFLDDCRRLLYGPPLDPSAAFREYANHVDGATLPQHVSAALGLTLRRSVGASAIRMTVIVDRDRRASCTWPEGAQIDGEEVLLGRPTSRVGTLWLLREDGPLGVAELELVTDLATQAALLTRALVSGTPVPVADRPAPLGTAGLSRRRTVKRQRAAAQQPGDPTAEVADEDRR